MKLFSIMGGMDVSNVSGWSTFLPVTYRIGGNIIANLTVMNDFHSNDTIQNVYGYMEGDKYPDEIVMLGAHRDAWMVGACDDFSGTNTMLEIAKSLSTMKGDGREPTRSVMFASWDAEELGLFGELSTTPPLSLFIFSAPSAPHRLCGFRRE